MCKPPKGNHFMASLTQDNLGAHKDNPTRDNLRPWAVHFFPIRVNLLVTKGNLVPSKVIRLVSQGSLTSNKANLVSSRVIPPDKLGKVILLKVNQ